MSKGDYSFVIGKSLLKNTIETDLSIIKKNKNTILNHICIEEDVPPSKGLKLNSPKNRNSTYTSINCVLQ